MRGRSAVIALAVLAALCGAAAWWFATFERVEEDVDAPLRGEAAYNPLFALKRVLQLRGIEVESHAHLDLEAMALARNDTLVLAADVRTLTPAQVGGLLAWMRTGGQMIFALPQGDEGRGGELLDALELSVVRKRLCLGWPVDSVEKNHTYCFAFRFQPKADLIDSFDVLAGDDAGYVIGRRASGEGGWLVAGNLDFLRNRNLHEPGNAALAWQVLAPSLGGGTVHLVYASDIPPLYVLLVQRGWPALLPALLAVLAALWARSQRFGPLLPLADARRRALREHLEATGDFTFRRGRGSALYAPLRRAFLARLGRDDPALVALDDDALAVTLAARLQRPLAEIRQALHPINLGRPEVFLATIKTLTELRIRP